MKFKKIKLKDLTFTQTSYSNDLESSIVNVGISIPVRVSIKDQNYIVVDGNKRCSIINNNFNEDYEVLCVLIDDFTSSGSKYWGNRNHH